MKKILFDFITLQDDFINGGMLYTQKILYELLRNNVIIYGLYDEKLPVNKNMSDITEKNKINLLNIRDKKIFEIIDNLQIDTVFIGIAQRYNVFNLCGLKCKVVVVCHDLSDLSFEYFEINQSKSLKIFARKCNIFETSKLKTVFKFILYPLVLVRRSYIRQKYSYANFNKLIQKSNVFVITVSQYSKNSIQYFLDSPKNDIKVYYPPAHNENIEGNIENIYKKINRIKKYFLLVSVDRLFKNAALFFEQWDRFCSLSSSEYYCVLVGKIKVNFKNCIVIDKTSSGELAFLYKNAFALIYSSFAEGFGSPPIEAAAYGTPSICANVTSIPEICGDMAVYFSPFYPEDLFRAMIEMTKNRDIYVEKTKKRFLKISQRQENDFGKLMGLILS